MTVVRELPSSDCPVSSSVPVITSAVITKNAPAAAATPFQVTRLQIEGVASSTASSISWVSGCGSSRSVGAAHAGTDLRQPLSGTQRLAGEDQLMRAAQRLRVERAGDGGHHAHERGSDDRANHAEAGAERGGGRGGERTADQLGRGEVEEGLALGFVSHQGVSGRGHLQR